MHRIFLSYRRSDSQDVTGRIYDRLLTQFGPDTIFKDVDAIPVGGDFKRHLTEAVTRCQVLLAVVGAHWGDARDESGGRRLDSADDFVRIEIEAALARGIPIIPILVANAAMPTEAQLPPTLAAFACRQATTADAGR